MDMDSGQRGNFFLVRKTKIAKYIFMSTNMDIMRTDSAVSTNTWTRMWQPALRAWGECRNILNMTGFGLWSLVLHIAHAAIAASKSQSTNTSITTTWNSTTKNEIDFCVVSTIRMHFTNEKFLWPVNHTDVACPYGRTGREWISACFISSKHN